MRALFAIAGLAALAWGAWLVWDFATSSTRDGVQALAWFVGGPVLHDGLIAPAVGVVGLAIARYLPRPVRAPVAIGLVATAVLTLLAIPLLWRPFGVPDNPGLHDVDYAPRLALALGACWLLVLLAALATTLPVRKRDSPAGRGDSRAGRGDSRTGGGDSRDAGSRTRAGEGLIRPRAAPLSEPRRALPARGHRAGVGLGRALRPSVSIFSWVRRLVQRVLRQ